LPFDNRNCREVFQRLDDYLDCELTPDEMEEVRRHLEVCAMCAEESRVEADILRDVRGKLQRLGMPPDAKARLWAVLGLKQRPSSLPNGTQDPR